MVVPTIPEETHAKLLRRSKSAGEGLASFDVSIGQQGGYEPYSDEDEDSLHPSVAQTYYSHKRGLSEVSSHYTPLVVPQGPNRTPAQPTFSPPSWQPPPPPPPQSGPQHPALIRSSSSQPFLAASHSGLAQSVQDSHHLGFTPGRNHLTQGSPVNYLPSTTFNPAGPFYPPHPTHRPSMFIRSYSEGPAPQRPRSTSMGGLERAGTLLSHGVGPVRNGKELNRILGKGEDGRKVVGGANGKKAEDVRLEAGRRKAKVEIDVMLERDILVEGGEIKGRMEVKVREWNKKEGDVYVGGGKVRVVGFEDIPTHNSRHIFYHHSHTLPLFYPNTTHRSSLFDASPSTSTPAPLSPSEPNFRLAITGSHDVPFFLPLPITNFPRGPFRSSHGSIKYILIASLKLYFPSTGKKSIAHFYRHVTIYPFVDVDRVLRNFETPLEVEKHAKVGGWAWGKSGKVELNVKSARGTWVAGQQCWLDIGIRNDGTKKVDRLDLVLYQITTFYHPVPHLNMGSCISGNQDADAVQTSSRRKKISEFFLEAGQNGGRGLITGKGWWKGCEPKRSGTLGCGIQIPPDALSIPRGRLIEVNYLIRVIANGSLQAELPIRIINFISIDPPPCPSRPAPVRASNPPIVLETITSIPNSSSQALSAHPESLASNYGDTDSGRRPSKPTSSTDTKGEKIKKAKSMGSLRAQSIASAGKKQFEAVVLAVRNPSKDEEESSDDSKGLLTHRASMAFLKTTIAAAAEDDDGGDEHESGGEDDEDAYLGRSMHTEDHELEDLYGDDHRSLGETSSGLAPFAYDDEAGIDVDQTSRRHSKEILNGEDSSGIGEAMRTLMIESDEDASEAGDDEILNVSSRWSFAPSSHPIVKSHTRSSASSPVERASSVTSSAWSARQSGVSPKGRSASLASFNLSLPRSHGSPLAPDENQLRRLSSAVEHSDVEHSDPIDEAPEPVVEARRELGTTVRPSSSLSIHPELLHPVARSPRPSFSNFDNSPRTVATQTQPIVARSVLPPSITVEEEDEFTVSPVDATRPSTPPPASARVLNKKASFSFASQASPVRVKVRPKEVTGASPARVRPSKSSSSLRSTPPPSPVRSILSSPKKLPLPTSTSSPLRTTPGKASDIEPLGRYTPKPLGGGISPAAKSSFSPPPKSPARPRVQTTNSGLSLSSTRMPSVITSSNSELNAQLPGLGGSSESGSSSDATPPLPSRARMGSMPLLTTHSHSSSLSTNLVVVGGGGETGRDSPQPKLFHTNKHLSQSFASPTDASVYPGGGGGPPRSYSLDLTGAIPPSRSRTLGRPSSTTSTSSVTTNTSSNVLPSVRNKINQLENRNSILREFTSPAGSALRRSATSARASYYQLPAQDAGGDGWGDAGNHRRTGSEASQVSMVSSSASDVTSLGGGGLSVNQRGGGASGLKRAPSAVSFRAPLLRLSVSGQGGQGGPPREADERQV